MPNLWDDYEPPTKPIKTTEYIDPYEFPAEKRESPTAVRAPGRLSDPERVENWMFSDEGDG